MTGGWEPCAMITVQYRDQVVGSLCYCDLWSRMWPSQWDILTDSPQNQKVKFIVSLISSFVGNNRKLLTNEFLIAFDFNK